MSRTIRHRIPAHKNVVFISTRKQRTAPEEETRLSALLLLTYSLTHSLRHMDIKMRDRMNVNVNEHTVQTRPERRECKLQVPTLSAKDKDMCVKITQKLLS